MLDMSDVFNARLSCKYFHESITPEQTKKLLTKKRKQLELALIKNRYNILVEITKSKPKFNQKTWKLRLTGKLEGLFQTMKENSIITEKLREIGGEYREKELMQKGFERLDMKHLSNIYGDNLWSITMPGTTETIALVPRQIRHGFWCRKHRHNHSQMILEMIYFQINTGFKDALLAVEETAFRQSRVMPLFGEKDTLEKLLDTIGMYEARTNRAGSWVAPKVMYLPPIRCDSEACVTDEAVPSGGL